MPFFPCSLKVRLVLLRVLCHGRYSCALSQFRRNVSSYAYALNFNLIFTDVISQSIHEVRWLPCNFSDEHVEIVEEVVLGKKMNVTETKFQHRDAVLQFGQPGDSPVHAELITFLVTGEFLLFISMFLS